MSIVARHATDTHVGIHWSVVSGVQSIVFVARVDDRPMAILEMRGGRQFHLTTTTGTLIGIYPTVDDAQGAFETWLGERR
jgi:hypothetical protein